MTFSLQLFFTVIFFISVAVAVSFYMYYYYYYWFCICLYILLSYFTMNVLVISSTVATADMWVCLCANIFTVETRRSLGCGHFAEHNAMQGSKTTGLWSLCRPQSYARLKDHWTVVTLQSRGVLPPTRRATRNTAAGQGGLPGTRFSETCPLPVGCRLTTRRPLPLPPHGG